MTATARDAFGNRAAPRRLTLLDGSPRGPAELLAALLIQRAERTG